MHKEESDAARCATGEAVKENAAAEEAKVAMVASVNFMLNSIVF
jgi:hypothetical protein